VRGTLTSAPMPIRHQRGHIFRKGAYWYVRFYDNVAESDGRIVRRQVCRKVAAVKTTVQRPKSRNS
jgi:hypothetical protein